MTEGTPIPNPTPCANLAKPSAPKSSLDFRLDVISKQFQVYSAKKFPGLATSTNISRVIAEQGCRVRIRRDVRMRRRGDKRPGDYDFDEERMYRSSDRFSTPDSYTANPVERARSTSISTVDHAYYGPGIQRRPSAEYGFPPAQSYPRPMAPAPAQASTPAPAAPPPPSHAPAYPSHLSFGATQTQYPAPHLPRTQPATTPTNVYSPRPSISHARNPSVGTEYDGANNGYSYPQPRVQNERSAYPKTALPPLRLELPPRLEPPKALNVQRSSEARSTDPNAYQSIIQPPVPRAQTPHAPSLPPLRSLSGEYTNNPSQPQNGVVQSPGPDLTPGKRILWETNHSVSKRTYGDTFGHDERPLYNGMRPDAENFVPSRSSSDASRVSFYSDSRDEMAYKRANGRMATKISPALQ